MKRIILILAIILSAAVTAGAFEKGYEKRVEAYAFAGLTDYNKSLFGVSMVNGWRITPSSYVGLGVGYEYSDILYVIRMKGNQSAPQHMFPVYGEYKFNFHPETVSSPFLVVDAGWVFNTNGEDKEGIDTKSAYGLMASARYGIDVSVGDKLRVTCSVGPRIQHIRVTEKYSQYGKWEYRFLHNYLTSI
jgi:hypothetical protein